MGRMQADAMAELGIDLDISLEWHLQANHYPPIHRVFIPVAKEAIERANQDQLDEVIAMPNGITKTVGEIVQELHLDSFLDHQDLEDY